MRRHCSAQASLNPTIKPSRKRRSKERSAIVLLPPSVWNRVDRRPGKGRPQQGSLLFGRPARYVTQLFPYLRRQFEAGLFQDFEGMHKGLLAALLLALDPALLFA